QSIDFEISFIPVGGFNEQIRVSISNVPEGVETIFSSRPFDIPITFSITFRVPNNVRPEIYRPIVTASGGGITHQKTVIIHVLERGSSTQLFGVQPNPFTPNNDGFNDYAIFNFPETINGAATILIFDVNGRKIAEIRNSTNWYGKDDNGRDVKPGAYIYIIKDGERVVSKGVVTLAR
ncbi:MAG: gliding motility-associated C-terminal domain-containing protein, partial [bacterium]|nr:gliding motility-associated C-terminal domain-containing protein [bacterium]